MGVSNFVKILKSINISSKFICLDFETKNYDLIVIDLMCYLYAAAFTSVNHKCNQPANVIFTRMMSCLIQRLLEYGDNFEFVIDSGDRCASKKLRPQLNEEVKRVVSGLLKHHKMYVTEAVTTNVKSFYFSKASSEAECHAWWKYKTDLSRRIVQVSRDSDIFIIDSIHNLDHITAMYDDTNDGFLKLQKPLSCKQRNFINVLLTCLGNDYLDSTYTPSKYEMFCGNIISRLDEYPENEVIDFKAIWCILAKSTIQKRNGSIKYSIDELKEIYKIRELNWNWYKNYILTSNQGEEITRCDYKRNKDTEKFYSNSQQY